MAAILSALLRRDASRTRRAGTGRQTTKRTFMISLPGARGNLRSATVSPRNGKRSSKGMEDVSKYWPSTPLGAENVGIQTQERTGVEDAAADKDAATQPNGAAPSRASIGLSPISTAGVEQHPSTSKEQPSASKDRHSMGTSPIVQSPAKPSPSSSDDSGPPSPQPTPSDRHSSPEPSPQPSEQSSPEPEPEPVSSPEPSPQPSEQSSPQPSEQQSPQPSEQPSPQADPDELEPQPDPDELEEPPPPPPPKRERKQGTRTRKNSLEKLDPTGRGIVPVLPPEEAEGALLPNGGGRSRRQRFRPLEFWRGERVIYGRRDSAKFEAIVDVDVKPRSPTPQKKPRGGATKRKPTAAEQGGSLVPFEAANGAGSSTDPLANAIDAMASSDDEAPIQVAGGRRVKKKAKKAA